eukprot:326519-Chlamydomonas_euryale.AAC.1
MATAAEPAEAARTARIGVGVVSVAPPSLPAKQVCKTASCTFLCTCKASSCSSTRKACCGDLASTHGLPVGVGCPSKWIACRAGKGTAASGAGRLAHTEISPPPGTGV